MPAVARASASEVKGRVRVQPIEIVGILTTASDGKKRARKISGSR